MKRDENEIEVLLVEDDEDDAALAERALAKSGVAVRLQIARNGQEALNFLYRRKFGDPSTGEFSPPDLVLLDMNMPLVGGLDVLRQMKTDPSLQTIPVVVLTGEADQELMRECMELGTNMYLVKPLEIADIMNIVVGVRKRWVAIDKLNREAA